ncbi:unnamed protein product [Clonostachys byssicola]|uniref:Nucleoside phosphorylase domain-containing protein n=1 Tax=Clonostachys byssicola TaxID=160290 RepID=A0A9N9Y4S9_9HYPO|nr:unnamed protein product [Clonostachys byssicola]
MEPNIEDYSIGWICALQEEYEAGCRMLDEEFDGPETNRMNDDNTYVYGRIGLHNIVIVCLPRYGLSQATNVAKDMARSFPNFKFALMVGIGGGAPSTEHDIRLGDVVVSVPRGAYGGVYQYDLGKSLEGDRFQHSGHQNSPPPLLLGAVSELQRRHNDPRKPDMIAENLVRMQDMPTFGTPQSDRLYRSDYLHSGEAECSNCDPAALIDRRARINIRQVTVHYGTIASGNTVMKNAATRDKYAGDPNLKIMCFEMEAAGLMNHFPCLVIRGICDYSDSHKNDEWHAYAALTAAAYARALLHVVKPTRVTLMPSWAETFDKALNQIKEQVSSVSGATDQINKHNQSQNRLQILNWITPLEYNAQQSDFFERSCPGTGVWFLKSEEYRTWMSTAGQTLYCPGNQGVGKTILASIIINDLFLRSVDDKSIGLAYIYCSYLQPQEQKPADHMACVLKQLAARSSCLPMPVIELYNRHKTEKTRATLQELLDTLVCVAKMFSRIFIVIDALDEYPITDGGRSKFLSALLALQSQTSANLLMTSRNYAVIKRRMEGSRTVEIHANDMDLRRYLQERIAHGESKILQRPGFQEKVAEGVIKSVNGVFLLAKLQLDSLLHKKLPRDVRQALESLPSGSEAYDRAYDDAMTRINSQGQSSVQFARRILSWIVFAKRDLSPRELQHAVSMRHGDRDITQEDLPDVEDILSVCAGLVTVEEHRNVVGLIHKTTQEYFQRTYMQWFPDANSVLIDTCITYLSFKAFEDGPCATRIAFETRIQNYPLCVYAANYWGKHTYKNTYSIDQVVNFLKSTKKTSSAFQVVAATEISWREFGPQYNATAMPGLHLAAYFGIYEVIPKLVEVGSVDLVDWRGRTALWWASRNGHERTVALLLDHKANSCIGDSESLAPLWLATYRGHLNIAEMLVERGHAKDIDFRLSTLCLAAERGYLSLAKLLIDTDPNVIDIQYRYRRPLLLATGQGHSNVVKLLLEKGAYTDSKDGDSRTPLSLAAESGHQEIVKLLLYHGANVKTRDSRGRIPLWYSIKNEQDVIKDEHEAVARMLLGAGMKDGSRIEDEIKTTLALASDHDYSNRQPKLQYEPWFEDEELESRRPIGLNMPIDDPVVKRSCYCLKDLQDTLTSVVQVFSTPYQGSRKDAYFGAFPVLVDGALRPEGLSCRRADFFQSAYEEDNSLCNCVRDKSPDGWFTMMYGY